MTSKFDSALKMIDLVLGSMVEQQERKVLELGRQIHPGLTAEDARNPHDFADLSGSSQWNFEDGILSGIKSAHIALRAFFLEQT